MDAVVAHLAAHQFRALFIERLGWDRAQGCLLIGVDGHEYRFETIAHKRGLAVMECQADRYTMFNRQRLRLLQKQVLKQAHEHIVIYRCDDPRKQVWQWAVHLPDGRRVRHREHPFFSGSPPESLLQRLAQLRFTLQEEEQVTLLDALARVRAALDAEAEINLFVNKPRYAEQSDRLALAMQGGDERAFRAFVEFHLPLAAWGAKRWRRYLLGLDDEDAIQIATIGLIEGARRFDRSRGTQFSTYAYHWIRQACQKYGLICGQFVRFPPHVLPECRAAHRRAQRLLGQQGPEAMLGYLAEFAQESPTRFERYRRYALASSIESVSEPEELAWSAARLLIDSARTPLEVVETEDLRDAVERVVSLLGRDDAVMIRLRYGFYEEPQTLEQIAGQFGLTRERIRQRLQRSEEALLPLFCRIGGFEKFSAGRNSAKNGSTLSERRKAINANDIAHAVQAVYRTIRGHTAGIVAVELAQQCGLQKVHRKAALRTLLAQGLIVRIGQGRSTVYRASEPDRCTPVEPDEAGRGLGFQSYPQELQGRLFDHAH